MHLILNEPKLLRIFFYQAGDLAPELPGAGIAIGPRWEGLFGLEFCSKAEECLRVRILRAVSQGRRCPDQPHALASMHQHLWVP